MDAVIEKLKSWKIEIMHQLQKEKTNDLITNINEIDKSIYFLELLSKFNISPNEINTFIELPVSKTGYSEYRIMNDCESENRNFWLELMHNGKPIRCFGKDLIMLKH